MKILPSCLTITSDVSPGSQCMSVGVRKIAKCNLSIFLKYGNLLERRTSKKKAWLNALKTTRENCLNFDKITKGTHALYKYVLSKSLQISFGKWKKAVF